MQVEPQSTLPSVALIVLGKTGVSHYPLPKKGTLTIGRDHRCDVPLADTTISRRHAKLLVNSSVQIVDLGSSNGTFVGECRLAPGAAVEITPASVLRVGETALMLQSVAGVELGRPQPSLHGSSVVHGEPRLDPDDASLRRLVPQIDVVAAGAINVLIQGETGVGKEVVARAIHRLSRRGDAPLVSLNCCALSESLIESELFGHERGAFTGAVQTKVGLLEAANGGTVFLDEVGEMPLTVQAKLLRAIEQKELLRVGSVRPRIVDVRFISATNRDVDAEVAAGRFRSDLYFRLTGMTVSIPPLRERVDEIVPLARGFLSQACASMSRSRVPTLSSDAVQLLERYAWPGNVRELRNVIERAATLCTSDTITAEHLPTERMTSGRTWWRTSDAAARAECASHQDLDVIVPDKERERLRILEALRQCRGNQTQAARLLGISRRTIVARISEYRAAHRQLAAPRS